MIKESSAVVSLDANDPLKMHKMTNPLPPPPGFVNVGPLPVFLSVVSPLGLRQGHTYFRAPGLNSLPHTVTGTSVSFDSLVTRLSGLSGKPR
jgi:hypothetical protein